MGNEIGTTTAPTVFPSPIGELHFSINYKVAMVKFLEVSVPYRGATFLNRRIFACRVLHARFPSPIGELHFSIKGWKTSHRYRIVSVPYRGATFLNKKADLFGDYDIEFPSPIGELHFSITNSAVYVDAEPCFRPLSGSYISQYIRNHCINTR